MKETMDIIRLKRRFQKEGAHRRYFWRIRHRLGPAWWRMTDKQVDTELRMISHRRAL